MDRVIERGGFWGSAKGVRKSGGKSLNLRICHPCVLQENKRVGPGQGDGVEYRTHSNIKRNPLSKAIRIQWLLKERGEFMSHACRRERKAQGL